MNLLTLYQPIVISTIQRIQKDSDVAASNSGNDPPTQTKLGSCLRTGLPLLALPRRAPEHPADIQAHGRFNAETAPPLRATLPKKGPSYILSPPTSRIAAFPGSTVPQLPARLRRGTPGSSQSRKTSGGGKPPSNPQNGGSHPLPDPPVADNLGGRHA